MAHSLSTCGCGLSIPGTRAQYDALTSVPGIAQPVPSIAQPVLPVAKQAPDIA